MADRLGATVSGNFYQYDYNPGSYSPTSLEEGMYRVGQNLSGSTGFYDSTLPAGLGSHVIKVMFNSANLNAMTYPNPPGGSPVGDYPLVNAAAESTGCSGYVPTPLNTCAKGNWNIDGATGNNVGTPTSLALLAASAPMYELFHDPSFTTYILETTELGCHNNWDALKGTIDVDTTCIQNELQALTVYLLTTYKGTGKTFILQNWEADNAVAASDSAWGITNSPETCTTGEANYPTSFCNSVAAYIQWLNARWNGVNNGRNPVNAGNYTNVTVAAAFEVNIIDGYILANLH